MTLNILCTAGGLGVGFVCGAVVTAYLYLTLDVKALDEFIRTTLAACGTDDQYAAVLNALHNAGILGEEELHVAQSQDRPREAVSD